MRKLLVGGLFAAAMCACAFFVVTSQSGTSEGDAKSDIEREFADTVSRVASLRETNRSTAIGVTELFKQITDKHPLPEFQGFVGSHYKLVRVKDVYGNAEYTDIDANSLRKIDRRFFPQDNLRIGFRYDSDWKYIVNLWVTLLNDGGI
jgi:hypothetical protein